MEETVKVIISSAAGLFVLWQLGGEVRRRGGWKAVRESGGLWFIALSVVAFGAGLYLSSDLPRGDMSRPARALLALGSMACAVVGMFGLLRRLSSNQFRRFSERYARLREEGHLADDPDAPLRATSIAELERLDARLWETRLALKGAPDRHRLTLGDARELIDRDLRRIDEALDEAHAGRLPVARGRLG